MRSLLAFGLVLLTGSTMAQERDLARVQRSSVTFTSEAPLETISATNTTAKGLLDRQARTFAVQVPVAGFTGFNSPLQREHFSENYMVASSWPNASFAGRIIEAVDLSKAGTYDVRAKGTLTIRGSAQERIVPCQLEVDASGIRARASFDVLLADHGIRIPRVVQQKIAASVRVDLDVLFAPGNSQP